MSRWTPRHPTRTADLPPGDLDLGGWAHHRVRYVDNLKVLLVGAVIVGHAVIGYSALEWWPYAEMNEVELATPTQALLYVLAGPFVLLVIPLFFLVAGMLTPGSLTAKGPRRFATDRLVRLGVPFLLYVLVLQPPLMYPVHPPGPTGSYWSELVGGERHSLDTGPLWFVGVLLIFSVVYAAWVAFRGERGPARLAEVSLRRLLVAVAVVAVATFVVRLWVPYGGSNPGIRLNVFEWPASVAVFALGTIGWRQGWLARVPDRLARQCRAATLVTFLLFGLVVGAAALLGVPQEDLWGGPHWGSLAWAAGESGMAVLGSVWLLRVAQRHLERSFRWAPPAVSRSAYGAFMLQTVFLVGLAFALRPLGAPAEVKALLLATGSLAGSFGLAWLLMTRVRGVSRVV